MQPLSNRPWTTADDLESHERSSPPQNESPTSDEEQEEVDEEAIHCAQMDIWEINMMKSDHHSIQEFLNPRIDIIELPQGPRSSINTHAFTTQDEVNLSEDENMEDIEPEHTVNHISEADCKEIP